ncbi:hypothetical protein FHX74_003476 [Friedmanniella endophytica]|uniref:Probable queuosine precursor transporter n=1 Tax=Microlunatus kandeliicorticis TaxID=1759536 RepID=A0A7W3IVF8_9ACTN|nr:queuosine precursor transporter [Microlunatus kandeliicorticis]MBA8795835.1 hypothetical protein [Microlunatus kandeliicorticis]
MTALDRPVVTAAPRYADGRSSIFAVIIALFCTLLVVSNIAATKPIAFGPDLPPVLPIITDGGAFLFPLTYILGDILAEVYGMRRARLAIIVGFCLAALASVTFLAVGAAPPAPGYTNDAAFEAVLGFVPRIVIASLCGFLAGQFLNAFVVVRIKRLTRERRLWTRLVGSTVVGELADTAIFCTIAFAGILSARDLINYTVVGYLYKCAVEVIFLPITYAVIGAIKRHEPSYGAVRDVPVPDRA